MTKKTKVTESEAGALHALLVEVMEVGLRTQLQSGQLDNALVRNVVTYLNNNNITVSPTGDERMARLTDLVKTLEFDLPDTRY